MSHSGLPVSGYVKQSNDNVAMVNANKRREERILREMDAMQSMPGIDKRWLAIARTQMEQAFMALNRSIFVPQRVKLSEDPD